MLLTEGQMSDYKPVLSFAEGGAALMFDALPPAEAMIADKGYDADWFRQALTARGTTPCIPSKSNRKVPIPHDTVLYRQRHLIENMFGKLKDWRRIHTRYDRCAHTFFSAYDRRYRPLLARTAMSPEPSTLAVTRSASFANACVCRSDKGTIIVRRSSLKCRYVNWSSAVGSVTKPRRKGDLHPVFWPFDGGDTAAWGPEADVRVTRFAPRFRPLVQLPPVGLS